MAKFNALFVFFQPKLIYCWHVHTSCLICIATSFGFGFTTSSNYFGGFDWQAYGHQTELSEAAHNYACSICPHFLIKIYCAN